MKVFVLMIAANGDIEVDIFATQEAAQDAFMRDLYQIYQDRTDLPDVYNVDQIGKFIERAGDCVIWSITEEPVIHPIKITGAVESETFTLPKLDGTTYKVIGKALTPVYPWPYDSTTSVPCAHSVIELQTGEKVLYIYSRPEYRHANKHVPVQEVIRRAHTYPAHEISKVTGYGRELTAVYKALGISTAEIIA